jgi:hypothetical protein
MAHVPAGELSTGGSWQYRQLRVGGGAPTALPTLSFCREVKNRNTCFGISTIEHRLRVLLLREIWIGYSRIVRISPRVSDGPAPIG